MPDQLSRITDTLPLVFNEADEGTGSLQLNWILPAGSGEPPYWSKGRDSWLRSYWKSVDALKTAVSTFVAKTMSIPFTIHPMNYGIESHIALANRVQLNLYRNSGTIAQGPMRGLRETLSAFCIDYLTQDNGAFLYIMGDAPMHKPLVGGPLGLLHLDSARCDRTGDPEFPVIYNHADKSNITRHKLHYTRVIDVSHLPNPDEEMNGVGVSPVTCCLMAAREIEDIYRFSQEKFGSRPPRQILYAKTGANISGLTSAIDHWQLKLTQANRSHFGGTLILAPKNPTSNLELDVLNLSEAPDGFDRKDVTMFDKAEIAAAFGLDLLDLSMSFGIQGQTRANADVQTRKGRGKGPGALSDIIISKLMDKYLPESLLAVADNVDDDQDEQRAQIMNERSQAYARQTQFSIRDIRSARIDMLNSKEITQQQFDELELSDGRLSSGIPVTALFYSQDATITSWLALGVTNPTSVRENDAEIILSAIEAARVKIMTDLQARSSKTLVKMGMQCLAALDALEKSYAGDGEQEPEEKNPPSLRKIERAELTGDKTEREIQTDNMPQDNQLKELDPAWMDDKIDPYSLTPNQVAAAISSFNEANPELPILEATVV